MSKWIARGSNNEDAEVNLLLFTYAGGSPSLFAPWKRLFDRSVNFCPILYPGRELRKKEEIPERLEQMVKSLVEENESLFSKSFVLFGHCTGNLIAYETAKYVKKRIGTEPLLFIASGSNSPRNSVYGDILKDEAGKDVSDEVLAQRMVKIGIVSSDFIENQNFIRYYMPIYRSDLNMLSKFQKRDPIDLDCNIHVMYGDKDEYVSQEGLHDWENYSVKPVHYESFSGAHFYLTEQKEIVVDKIKEAIASSRKGQKHGKQVQTLWDAGIHHQSYSWG